MSSEVSDRNFQETIDSDRRQIHTRLAGIIDAQSHATDDIREALRYTLLDGGKRFRPLLCLWVHDAVGGSRRPVCLDTACAIECLHTYSLVHDDLPCMDDDDQRRGKPSAHVRFGEAMAVLAGDALLTLCFEVLATLGDRHRVGDRLVVELLKVVSGAAGTGGLITGQSLDLVSDRLTPSEEVVEVIHRRKTAALISAAMEAGAIVGEADEGHRLHVRRAGILVGQAFQIVDDVLDVETDGDTLGKTPGKDVKDGKLTYPSVVGIEPSKRRAAELVGRAKGELGTDEGAPLGALMDMLVTRLH